MTDINGIVLKISQEALDSGAVTIEGAAVTNPEEAAEPETGTYENKLPFTKDTAPKDESGWRTGAQARMYDSIYGIDYLKYVTGAWWLERDSTGIPYLCNAKATEFMECLYGDPPDPTVNNYVLVIIDRV